MQKVVERKKFEGVGKVNMWTLNGLDSSGQNSIITHGTETADKNKAQFSKKTKVKNHLYQNKIAKSSRREVKSQNWMGDFWYQIPASNIFFSVKVP